MEPIMISDTERTKTMKIGFVGLGHMGGNMAARFLAAGYTVYGESRDRRDAQDLVHGGTRPGATRRARSPTLPTSSSRPSPTTVSSRLLRPVPTESLRALPLGRSGSAS